MFVAQFLIVGKLVLSEIIVNRVVDVDFFAELRFQESELQKVPERTEGFVSNEMLRVAQNIEA
jgi:hypothetical protein